MILCYPVKTDHDTYEGTMDRVKESFGLENYVDRNTSRTFIWHAFEEQVVPVVSTV